MTDFGSMDVTSTCPVGGCSGTTVTRVFGNNAATKYYSVVCPTCAVTYTMKVVFTISGAVTSYELT